MIWYERCQSDGNPLLVVVNAALEPAHLSVWTTPAGPRP